MAARLPALIRGAPRLAGCGNGLPDSDQIRDQAMRLSTRLTVAMTGLVLLTATTVGFLTYRDVEAVALPRGLDRIDTRTRVLVAELEAGVRAARADVIGFASAVAVDGIIRARLAGGIDPIGGTSATGWRPPTGGREAAAGP